MPEEIDFSPTMFERTEFHRRKEQVLFQKQPSLRSFGCPSFRQGKVEAADAGPGQLATTLQPIFSKNLLIALAITDRSLPLSYPPNRCRKTDDHTIARFWAPLRVPFIAFVVYQASER